MCIIIYEGVFANRKSIFSKILSLIICLFLVFSTFSANVFALNEDADLDTDDDIIISNKLDDVWLSSSGSDSKTSTNKSEAFKTLEKATFMVANGGTIHVVDTYTVDSSTVWSTKTPQR